MKSARGERTLSPFILILYGIKKLEQFAFYFVYIGKETVR